MALLPKAPIDLSLAPVAAQVDLNLQTLRDRAQEEIEYELQLELDRPLFANTREERAEHVLRAAFRNIDLHGWHGSITEDGCRLRLSGGSVTIDLGLGETVMRYIHTGSIAPASAVAGQY
ncbi:MAG TPA: hypothetical protein VE127_09865 [Solirubrobacteraceae bacterium]|nr:hypothetical protein [Solirubrobacteraceae bacterium]